jgi:hypothetical protein
MRKGSARATVEGPENFQAAAACVGKYLVVPRETAMRKLDLTTMQFEELWQIYEELPKCWPIK